MRQNGLARKKDGPEAGLTTESRDDAARRRVFENKASGLAHFAGAEIYDELAKWSAGIRKHHSE